jgi:hypothetical protein
MVSLLLVLVSSSMALCGVAVRVGAFSAYPWLAWWRQGSGCDERCLPDDVSGGVRETRDKYEKVE